MRRRISDIASLWALSLSVLAMLPILPSFGQAQERVGIVTFTVDNITSRFFKRRMQVFFENDVPGTMFGQTKPITGEPGDIYWPEIREMIDHGWEFGAHGYSHDRMTEMDDDTLDFELGTPAAYIYRGTGVYPTSLASPHGAYDARVMERAKVYYDAHFRAWGNGGVNLFEGTDHYQIYREQLDNELSNEDTCAEIERAGREGHWMVVMLHRIVDEPTDEYENSTSQFEAAVSCAARLRDEGKVRLMNARDALKLIPHTPRARR